MSCKKEEFRKLAFDRISSSNSIALRMIKLAFDCVDKPYFKEMVGYVAANQSSMAVVLNVANRLFKVENVNDILSLKHEFVVSEKRVLDGVIDFLKPNLKIGTISFSKTVFDILLKIKPEKVYVSVSHPAKEGEILAKRLLNRGISVVLFEDAAYSVVMKDIDAILIGADAVLDDYVVNKIGSYPLALLAKEFNKPFYVVANKFKLLNGELGRSYKILNMDTNEISKIDCDIINVYFEKVPKKLIDKIFMG